MPKKKNTHPATPTALTTYTAAETARILHVSLGTLANWRSQHKGPRYIQTGAKHSPVLYRAADIEKWLNENAVSYW